MSLIIIWQFILLFLAISRVSPYPFKEEPRTSIVDWTNYHDWEPHGKGTYAFGYDIEDPETNNVQFRDEERLVNGTVIGSYGYVKPDGNIFIVRYVADEKGYRATIEDSSKQLKHVQPSSILTTASQSNEVYKKQKVHESHARPTDQISGEKEMVAVAAYKVDEDQTDPYFGQLGYYQSLGNNDNTNSKNQQIENWAVPLPSSNDFKIRNTQKFPHQQEKSLNNFRTTNSFIYEMKPLANSGFHSIIENKRKLNSKHFDGSWLTDDKYSKYQVKPKKFRLPFN